MLQTFWPCGVCEFSSNVRYVADDQKPHQSNETELQQSTLLMAKTLVRENVRPLLILPTLEGWRPESSLSAPAIKPEPPAHMSEHVSEWLTL